MQLAERKSAVLSAIIQEHVQNGATVGSKAIVDNHDFKLSPATIRNEMSALDKEGFIYQPHTSAGRIPTEKGWKYYIENHLQQTELSDKQKKEIQHVLDEKNLTQEMVVKRVAKGLAALSEDAVFVGFSPENFYYTGLSNLFRQPEFQQLDLVCHISEVVDHMDETIQDLFQDLAASEQAKILVGSDNPFGKECSSIMASYQTDKEHRGVFGILGPMRMNYENNVALIDYARNIFSNA